MIGIAERTTMDMDTTVKGIPMEKDTIRKIIMEIIALDVGDGRTFKFIKIEPIYVQQTGSAGETTVLNMTVQAQSYFLNIRTKEKICNCKRSINNWERLCNK